jgi:RimJ/RimL family protein N-acetyltransferase
MIETERLRLRPQQIDDFEQLHALTASEEMHRFLGAKPNIEDDYRRLLATIGGWTVFGFDRFIVLERDGGAMVGTCGIFRLMRGLGEDFDSHPEAGWIIRSDRWGRGYASEAARAVIDWFERTQGRCRTVCMISPDNHASMRIAAKLGYRLMRAGEHRGQPVNLYARDPR